MSALRLALPVIVFCALLTPSLRPQGWLDAARDLEQPDPGQLHYLADFDADGVDDLVWFKGTPGTPTQWEGFRVLFNDGAGDLLGAGPFIAFPNNGHRFAPVQRDGVHRLRDVTGDGRPDVLVIEEFDYSLDVALHVYPSVGTGTFGAPLTLPMTGRVEGVALGDVDADPAFEVAVVEQFGLFTSQVVAWYDLVGGAFVKSATVSVPGGLGGPVPTRLVAFDLDADGDDDLVYGEGNGNKLRVFTTTGGAPSLHQSITLPVQGGTFLFPYVCDLVGGSATDLLVVAAQNSSAQFAFFPVLHVGAALAVGAPIAFAAESTVDGGGFALGDWDGDGDVDAMNHAWQVPGGSTEGIVAFFENDGANGFSGPVAKAETLDTGSSLVGTVDLDQDGALDVVLSQTALFGRGRFESSLVEVTSFYLGATPAAALDHEGDGDLDLFLPTGSVRLNDGDARFSGTVTTPPAPTGSQKRPAAGIGDFTGDGRVDFLVGIEDPGAIFEPPVFQEMRLYADDGLGGFVDAGTASTKNMEPYSREVNVAFDLDQDGDLDLLDATPGGMFPNTGAGTFLPLVDLFGASNEPSAVGDLDADGDPDVVTVEYPSLVRVWTNQGGLSFSSVIVHQDPGAIESDSVTLADQDGDGDLDLAFSPSWGEQILLFTNDGAGSFSAGAALSADVTSTNDPPFVSLAFGDVDGDGTTDLLAGAAGGIGSDTPREVVVYRGLGGGAYQSLRAYAGGSMGPPADLDGDGDLDLSGRTVVRSRRYDGPGDGTIRQFGAGLAGSGGAVPVLGAAGPLRAGSTTASLRVRRGLGAAAVVLLYGTDEAAIPNSPVFGATLYVAPPLFAVTVPTGGVAGVAGAGTLDVDLGPVLPVVAGFTLVLQAAVLDGGAPDGIATSNGLELRFGA